MSIAHKSSWWYTKANIKHTKTAYSNKNKQKTIECIENMNQGLGINSRRLLGNKIKLKEEGMGEEEEEKGIEIREYW